MLKGTKEVDLDWGSFYLSWSISKKGDVQWSRRFWESSSLGCIMGQTQREAVAEGSTSPTASLWCCILLMDQDQVWQVQQAARLARHEIPVPEVLTAMLRLLELVMCSRTGLLLWKEPQAWKLVSWRPNWLTPTFSSVQRTTCKPGKNSAHLMGRATSSAQKLLFQVAY